MEDFLLEQITELKEGLKSRVKPVILSFSTGRERVRVSFKLLIAGRRGDESLRE